MEMRPDGSLLITILSKLSQESSVNSFSVFCAGEGLHTRISARDTLQAIFLRLKLAKRGGAKEGKKEKREKKRKEKEREKEGSYFSLYLFKAIDDR